MIEVEVKSLTVEQDYALALLQEKGGNVSARRLSIPIGLHQSQLISMKLERLEFPRPLTHDLTVNIIKLLNAKLISVQIQECRDDLYYGKARVEFEGEVLDIDLRPSDGIALALIAGVPIYVSDDLMPPASLSSCPMCGGSVRYLNETDVFCLSCDWDNLPKLR